jgi:hypothetical protein
LYVVVEIAIACHHALNEVVNRRFAVGIAKWNAAGSFRKTFAVAHGEVAVGRAGTADDIFVGCADTIAAKSAELACFSARFQLKRRIGAAGAHRQGEYRGADVAVRHVSIRSARKATPAAHNLVVTWSRLTTSRRHALKFK